ELVKIVTVALCWNEDDLSTWRYLSRIATYRAANQASVLSEYHLERVRSRSCHRHRIIQHVGRAEADFLQVQVHLARTKLKICSHSIFARNDSANIERAVRIGLRRTRRGPKGAIQHSRPHIDARTKILRQGFSFDIDSSRDGCWWDKRKHHTVNVLSYVDRNCRHRRNRRRLTRLGPAIERQRPTNHVRARRNIPQLERCI